jgi:hypothetical protein
MSEWAKRCLHILPSNISNPWVNISRPRAPLYRRRRRRRRAKKVYLEHCDKRV